MRFFVTCERRDGAGAMTEVPTGRRRRSPVGDPAIVATSRLLSVAILDEHVNISLWRSATQAVSRVDPVNRV